MHGVHNIFPEKKDIIMKKNILRYSGVLVLAAVVILTALTPLAEADNTYYVNSKTGVLETSLDETWAIGGNGKALLNGTPVSVLASSGMTTIGSSTPINPITPSTPAVSDDDPAQKGLTVSGTIHIPADVIKIGLAYDSGALETASLSNVVGRGFEFGYYDSSRNFHVVGSTEETGITMMTDTNVKVSAGTVGCFHILLPDDYSDFETASEAAESYDSAFVGYFEGDYRVLIGAYENRDAATEAIEALGIDGTAYSASNRCITVTKTGTTRILFEFDGGNTYGLGVRAISSDKAITKYAIYQYYGGFQFTRLTGEKMTVVNLVDVEDYIKGVVSTEMSEGWPLEALKAQAVAARTYAMRNLNGYSSYGFDVTGTAASQAYSGTSAVGSGIVAAVEATAGQYLTYQNTLCDTVYFSSDGGGTEDSENVFYSALPYLRGVIDPYEEAAASVNSYSSWTRSWNADSIAAKVRAQGYSFGTLQDIETEYSDTGNVISITFIDDSGRKVNFSGSNCYAFCYYSARLNLPSIHFTIERSTTNSNVYVFEGGGWGHNVGMSQFGAYAMAKYYDKTYDQILAFYYTGVSLSMGVAD